MNDDRPTFPESVQNQIMFLGLSRASKSLTNIPRNSEIPRQINNVNFDFLY